MRTDAEMLSDYQEEFGLQDWDIILEDGEPESGYAAQVWRKEDEQFASIRIRGDLPRAQRERALAHELLHLLMLPIDRSVTFPTYHDADRYGYEQERFLNALSSIITGIPYVPDQTFPKR